MIPLLLVWLRAIGLVGQATALGGAAVCLIAHDDARARRLSPALAAAGALIVAIAQSGTLVALAAEVADGRAWPIAALLESTVGLSGLLRIACAVIATTAALRVRRAPDSTTWRAVLVVTVLLLTVTGALATHAVGWVGSTFWTAALSVAHQAAVGVWIGGLICAAALGLGGGATRVDAWLWRFSVLAATSAAMLAATGVAMSSR